MGAVKCNRNWLELVFDVLAGIGVVGILMLLVDAIV